MGNVTITRPASMFDLFSAYRIFVDGIFIADIASGERVEIDISAGQHDLEVHAEGCRSKIINVNEGQGAHLFQCGSYLDEWRMSLLGLYMMFPRREFLWIKPA